MLRIISESPGSVITRVPAPVVFFTCSAQLYVAVTVGMNTSLANVVSLDTVSDVLQAGQLLLRIADFALPCLIIFSLCIVASPCAGPVVIQCTASNPLVLIDPASRAQSSAPSGIAHLGS